MVNKSENKLFLLSSAQKSALGGLNFRRRKKIRRSREASEHKHKFSAFSFAFHLLQIYMLYHFSPGFISSACLAPCVGWLGEGKYGYGIMFMCVLEKCKQAEHESARTRIAS